MGRNFSDIVSRCFDSGILISLSLAIVLLSSAMTHAQVPQQNGDVLTNLKLKTLGGQQFWTDVRWTHGWRIQQNSETGHFRLLDSVNVRHNWGTLDQCNHALNEALGRNQTRLFSGKVVILLHGLVRTRNSMNRLERYLQQHGFQTLNFCYASSRNNISSHATALQSVVDQLGPQVTEIYFTGHSLGNIVVRRYLQMDLNEKGKTDPRIKRMVMIGPPNQGSRMARLLTNSLAFKAIAGRSGVELGNGWGRLEPNLATPDFEFGIIAGGQSEPRDLNNFLLAGPDDFTVSLAEASDLLVRPLLHSTMMQHQDTLAATLKFFQHGYFVTPESRSPIPEN